ncbi:protocadherin Fat 4-like, partial [Limulus polyphemus]|uniref:Protocadherin Fat 4-like n=1 Tax=Limulus polyphemus TaxID=6850 RepID=A0ABM1RYY1_LIMPO
LIIRLSARNSRCPNFPFSEYYSTVKESIAPDAVVVPNIQVEDAKNFEKLSYKITEDNSQGNFYVDYRNPRRVSVRARKALDRDTMPSILQGMYTLTVTARNERCASSVNVKIMVEDENDNAPVFPKQEYVVEVKENTLKGHVVTQLVASDKDELDQGRMRYFIAGGTPNREFQIEENTGDLSVEVPPDREENPSFMLSILAVDSANNT